MPEDSDVELVRAELLQEFEAFMKLSRAKRSIGASIDACLSDFADFLGWAHGGGRSTDAPT